MIAHLHASDSRLSGSPWCWAGTFPLCHPARGSCEPSPRSGDGQVLQKGLAQCQTFHSHEIFTILVSCTMAGGYICTCNSFILTVTALAFLFGRLVPYKEGLVALFPHLSTASHKEVCCCFLFTNKSFSSWKPCLARPWAVLPGRPAGLSITHLQGNGLSLSPCFSEPGHSAQSEAGIKQSLYFSPCRLRHLFFPSALSGPSLERVQDTAVISFRGTVFGRIDRREGRWITTEDGVR